MKKFWLSLTVLIMLSACKSVTFNDLNVQMPNANLLPPLNTEVDRESVRDSFDVQYSGSSSRSGYTDASGWGGSIDSVNIVRKRDRRMRDMITLFDRNAANVSQAYGERKGTIKLRVTNSSVLQFRALLCRSLDFESAYAEFAGNAVSVCKYGFGDGSFDL